MTMPSASNFVRPVIFAIAQLLLVVMSIPPVYAEWVYSGQNSLAYEFYDVKGEPSRGLYSDEGGQVYNDLSLNFSNRYSDYENVRGYLQASVNHSDYRQTNGTQLNAFAVNYENGENTLPLRLAVGDFFASQSRRTLQRGLKGLQLELQPLGWSFPQSIQLFAGRSAINYDDFFSESRHAYFAGGSWLMEQTEWGAFAWTSVHYHDDSLTQNNDEWVSSLAWEKLFSVGQFDYALEMELAYLTGENQQTDALGDSGRYIQLTGFSESGQDLQLSYERNTRYFSPQGAAVVANREAVDVQWGQMLTQRLNMRVRGQKYIDFVDEVNPQTTRLYGINVLGLPFSDYALNANLDVSLRTQKDKNRSYDRDTYLVNLNLALPINDLWRGRASFQWMQNDNNLTHLSNYRYVSSLGFDHTAQWLGWQANLSPSLNYIQDVDANNQDTSQLGAGIAMTAQRGNHSLLLSHQHTYFDTTATAGEQFDTRQSRFQWRANWQQNSVQFNVDWYAYHQSSTTDSYKASLIWTYQFDKQVAQAQTQRPQTPAQPFVSFDYLDDLQLKQLYQTEKLATVMAGSGWTSAGSSGVFDLFEGKLFTTVSNRQVLALEKPEDWLRSAHLLVFIEQASPQSVEQLYNHLLDKLLKIYGAPTRERSVGAFDNNWQQSLDINKLIRIVEWETDNGILRFGLPKPKIGQLRFELQLKQRHTGYDNNDWGIDLFL